MISVVTRYFCLNRFTLIILGLWPYQKPKYNRIQSTFILSTLITFTIFQFTKFITSEISTDLILDIVASGLVFIICVIKYNAFRINSEAIKYLLEQLQLIFNGLKDANEISIMDKYGRYGKIYTTVLMTAATSSLLLPILLPMWPYILNVVRPLNESRSRQLTFISTEYFIDQEKYFYLIVLHANAAIILGMITVVGTGTTLITYCQHACGLFRIARYRIDHAMRTDRLRNVNLKSTNLIHEGIISAVDMHRTAMRYAHFVKDSFSGSFAVLIIIGVFSLSLNFFRICEKLTYETISKDIIIAIGSLIIHYIYMFLGNYTAQIIMDHNNHIYATAYNVQWYKAPLHIQKMILFVLQRSAKPFYLQVGGLFVGSLEGFAMLNNAAISYFTVIYSVRQ